MATSNQIAYIDLLCDRLLEKELTAQQRKYVNWVSEFKYYFDKRWASEEIGKLKGMETEADASCTVADRTRINETMMM